VPWKDVQDWSEERREKHREACRRAAKTRRAPAGPRKPVKRVQDVTKIPVEHHQYKPTRTPGSVLELLDAPLFDALTEAKIPYAEVAEMKKFRASGWSLKRIARHYGCRVSLVCLAVKHEPLLKPATKPLGLDLAPEDLEPVDPLSLL